MLIVGLASQMSWRIAHIHQPQLGRLAHFFSERIYSTIFFASMSETSVGWHVPRPRIMDTFAYRSGDNSNGLRVASVRVVDVGGAGLGFVIRVAAVAPVLL